jgi:hypothetical protein
MSLMENAMAYHEERIKDLKDSVHALAFELDWCVQNMQRWDDDSYTTQRCLDTKQWLLNLEHEGLYNPVKTQVSGDL